MTCDAVLAADRAFDAFAHARRDADPFAAQAVIGSSRLRGTAILQSSDARCRRSPSLPPHRHRRSRQVGGMTDVSSLLPGIGLASIACVAGWLHLRRRHRRQIDKLVALHARQIGVSAQRLADAHRRSDVLKQEVQLLKKEILQQQRRWDHRRMLVSAPAAATHGPLASTVRARDELQDDGSGFADTQPWDPASP